MNREELEKKFARTVTPCELRDFGITVYLRGLSALARAKYGDRFNLLSRAEQEGKPLSAEEGVKEIQAVLVAQGLVDETGERLYQDDEVDRVADRFPAKALDQLAREIARLTGISSDKEQVEDLAKNSEPSRSDSLPSTSAQESSTGGMSTES